jgi:trk system potassium uptake protein TrkH
MRLFRRKKEGQDQHSKRRVNPPKLVAVSFLTAILVGSILLSLPFATSSEWRTKQSRKGLTYIDALFTSTSATCVTGLIVKDTGRDFSTFGKVVILLLIQMGGLGIMTMSTFFLLLFGRRISLRDSITVRTSLGGKDVRRTTDLIKHALFLTLGAELIGAAILFWRFRCGPDQFAAGKAACHAIFHSISAFCNAGFSLYNTSLIGKEWLIVVTMALLVICGGWGFLVVYNIGNLRFWKRDKLLRGRLSLQSKIVLAATAGLLALGFVAFLALEWKQGMSRQHFSRRLLNGFFCAVTPRTAGFNTIPYNEMSSPGLLLTMFLMFIGASPGSTGGGIKTCTFVVLLATSYAIMRGKENVALFRRTVPNRVVQEAIAVALISLLFVCIVAVALATSERAAQGWPAAQGGYLARTTFEVFSAFGTVGLSTGITPYLSLLGKIIVIITMFVGRIGPLALALIVAGRETRPSVAYPEEAVMIG